MSDQHSKSSYYLPNPSHWPIVACASLICTLGGAANWLHDKWFGPYMFSFGILLLFFMLFGWLRVVIRENRAGKLNDPQVDRSFRWGMIWFIFSEVMFFGTFFGVLYFSHNFVTYWLAGHGASSNAMTHLLLWPHYAGGWPAQATPSPALFKAPTSVMETWGIPLANTLILMSSGVTITFAHIGINKKRQWQAVTFQIFTILLGIAFLCMQSHEYWEAYTLKGLTLGAGIFGSTFFILTGFHALHVTVGTIMLCVMLWRICKHDFSKKNQFAFEAVSWYWHFVDVVWILLFIFVYWMG